VHLHDSDRSGADAVHAIEPILSKGAARAGGGWGGSKTESHRQDTTSFGHPTGYAAGLAGNVKTAEQRKLKDVQWLRLMLLRLISSLFTMKD